MQLISFFESLFYGVLLSVILAFFIPVVLFLRRRFGHRFKYSIPIAITVFWMFLINVMLIVVDLNDSFLGHTRIDSTLTRSAIPIGFIGFLIIFGKDIDRWKDDP